MLLRFGFVVLLCAYASIAFANPAPVIVTTLKTEPFAESIEAIGTLRANEAVTLSATVTKTINSIHFDDGQRVKANDILVQMTSDEELAQLAEAQSALAEAERQYHRVRQLEEANLANRSDLDQRRQLFESAQARERGIQARLRELRITAPFDGVVGLREISVGTLVRPGDTITTLDDDSVMKLDFSVPAVFISSLRPGLTVVARTRELSGAYFEGQIASIDSRIDPITRSIKVRAHLPNPQRHLRPGMLMTVTLQKELEPSLVLPEESLVQEGYKSYVYKLNPNSEFLTVIKQEVTTSSRRKGEVVVTSGLQEGDRVVTHGVMRLNHGSKINIRSEKSLSDALSHEG